MIKIIIFSLFLFNYVYAQNFKLEKIVKGLDSPWSLSFINDTNIVVTEKPGNIKFINLKKKRNNKY